MKIEYKSGKDINEKWKGKLESFHYPIICLGMVKFVTGEIEIDLPLSKYRNGFRGKCEIEDKSVYVKEDRFNVYDFTYYEKKNPIIKMIDYENYKMLDLEILGETSTYIHGKYTSQFPYDKGLFTLRLE